MNATLQGGTPIAALSSLFPPAPSPKEEALAQLSRVTRAWAEIKVPELTLTDWKLRPKQAIAAHLIRRYPRFALYWDVGVGKTAAVLGGVKLTWPARVLVVCPLEVIEGAWKSAIEKFAPRGLPFLNLHDVEKKDRPRALEAFPRGIAAINYESFRDFTVKTKMVKCEDPITGKVTKRESRSKRVTLPAWVRGQSFSMVVFDESGRFRSPRTDASKAALKAGQITDKVVLLSGTPFPNSLLESFTQGQLLGLPWGWSFNAWRNEIAAPEGFGGFNYEVTPAGYRRILGDLSRVSWAIKKSEELDLPAMTAIPWPVRLSDKESAAYRQMKKELLAEIEGQEVSAPSKLQQISKLRQLTSGFTYHEGETLRTGEAKLRALLELLDEIGPKQVLIWAHYKAEYEQIREALGPRVVEIHGDVGREDRREALRRFLAKEAPYLVAAPGSLGHGVDGLQYVCSYMIDFSLSYSYDEDYQQGGRLHRNGQAEPVTRYRLVVPKTVDDVMLDVIEQKATASDAVLAFLKGARG